MENIRAVLAVFAALVGIVLLASFLIRKRSSVEDASVSCGPSSALWIFGLLFLISGFVLWQRSTMIEKTSLTYQDQKIESPRPTAPSKPQADSLNAATESKTPSSLTGTPDATQSVKNSVEKAVVESKPKTKSNDGVSRAPTQTASNSGKKQSVPSNVPKAYLEDKIYFAVDRAFTWIEEFFDEYAVPVPSNYHSNSPAVATSRPIEFPAVQFQPGTADLTLESQKGLCTLADQLNHSQTSGILEIQARVDSIGPEALNFVLTQARANAVRDYLISEGVSADRLIAIGRGSENNGDKLADSRIDFVVR